MIRNSTPTPSPTPNPEAEDIRGLLLSGLMFSIAVFSFILLMLLLEQYYTKEKKKLLKLDEESDTSLTEEETLTQSRSSERSYHTFDDTRDDMSLAPGDRIDSSLGENNSQEDRSSDRKDSAFTDSAEYSSQVYLMSFRESPEAPLGASLYELTFSRGPSSPPSQQPTHILSPYTSTILNVSPIPHSGVRRRLDFSANSSNSSPARFFLSSHNASNLTLSPISGANEQDTSTTLVLSPISGANEQDTSTTLVLSPISGANEQDTSTTLVLSPIGGVNGQDTSTTLVLSPIGGANEQDTSTTLVLSPIGGVNEQNTPTLVLSPQGGVSSQGGRLYRIYSPQSGVPISPPLVPFIIEVKTATPAKKEKDIRDIDSDLSIDLSPSSSSSTHRDKFREVRTKGP